MKRFLLYIIGVFIVLGTYAQVPLWVKKGAPNSTSGKYFYAMGNSTTLEEAIYTTVKSGAKLQGFTAITDQKIERSLQIKNNKRTTNHTSIGTLSFADKQVNIFVAEQYFDYSHNLYYVLIGFTKNENIKPPIKPKISNANYIWRSAIVPGWGQFYNSEYKKAAIYIGSEVLLLGATIYTANKASSYMDKANQAFDYETKKFFIDKSDTWKTYRNVLSIGAAAVWIINIVDATASNKNRFALIDNKKYELFATQNQIGLKINLN